MILTDKEVIKAMKHTCSYELEYSIEIYPENERDGRDDWQMLSDEAGYIYSCYLEDGHCFKDDLAEAREKLRETKNGKFIPIDTRTMKPKYGYWPSDIEIAKNIVSEFRKLGNLLRKLQKKGYYSRWYTI